MIDVLRFKVRLCELKNVMWRDIEITFISSVAKMRYAVFAAFESTASHLFNIRFDGNRYETVFEDNDFDDEPAIVLIRTILSALLLRVGDKLSMKYVYGAGGEFEIELLSINEMKRGAGSHYSHVTAGKRKGIMEDISPYELAEMPRKQIRVVLYLK